MPSFSIPLSGLDANSAALSALSNNLANLNTVGYKSTTAAFHDLFYQQIGSSGSGDPIQLGVGSAISSMQSLFTDGSVQRDGVPTHVAIQQDGFFVTLQNGVEQYSRAGDFSQDGSGRLITADGALVLGYPANAGIVNTNGQLQPVTISSGQIAAPNATTQISLQANLDATAAVGDSFTASIAIYDSLGTSHTVTTTFTKSAANQWSYSMSIPAQDVGATGAPVVLSTGTLKFDGAGNLQGPTSNVTGIAIAGFADGANNLSFNWNLFSSGSGLVTQVASPSTTSAKQQDGFASGRLTSFSIGPDGVVQGSFSNGQSLAVGQIALATFANNQGLERVGDNSFRSTLASGSAVVGSPGTGGRGTLAGGALELSNVDIATEFSELIVAQRGFEANARAITTFDQITQDTINLKQA